MPNEVDKFFEGLPSEEKQQADIFEDPDKKPAEKQEGAGAKPEEGGEPRKNRRHRRLEQQLQEERELRIAAEARAEGRSEAQQFAQATSASDDTPDKWIRMYGDTPEARQAWALQKELLADVIQKTKADTIAEIEQREKKRGDAQGQFEKFIEGELEGLEDDNDVDLTSDAPAAKKARREFLELVQNLSPKENGVITGYADFAETWKIYQDRRQGQKPDASKAKDLADRSMNRPGDAAQAAADKPKSPGFYGWMKDLNISD